MKKKQKMQSSKRSFRDIFGKLLIWCGSKALSPQNKYVQQETVSQTLDQWSSELHTVLHKQVYRFQHGPYGDFGFVLRQESSGHPKVIQSMKRNIIPTSDDLNELTVNAYKKFEPRLGCILTERELKLFMLELHQTSASLKTEVEGRINEFKEFKVRLDRCLSIIGDLRTRYNQFLVWKELPMPHNIIKEGELEVAFLDVFSDWEYCRVEKDVQLFESFYEELQKKKENIYHLIDTITPQRRGGVRHDMESLIEGFRLALEVTQSVSA